MNCEEFAGYCSHCSTKLDGQPIGDVVLTYRGSRPYQYQLCLRCTDDLNRWINGGRV